MFDYKSKNITKQMKLQKKQKSISNPIIQMAKWKWNIKTKRWQKIEGIIVKGPPSHSGIRDGEIYDDEMKLGPRIPLRQPPVPRIPFRQPSVPRIPFRQPIVHPDLVVTPIDTRKPEPKSEFKYTGDDFEYMREMIAIQQKPEIERTELEKNRLNTWLSNANYFNLRLQYLKYFPLTTKKTEWEEALNKLKTEVGLSIFSRDIDAGELKAQPKSGGTMPTTLRMMHGYGRIRSYKDLNRGGGAGSYVRFISEKKAQDGSESKPLNFGGLAGLGVTILYDSISVLEDNKDPAHIAFNKQDSAGRIFGTDAEDTEILKAMSRFSQTILNEANPNSKRKALLPGEASFTDDYILQNAIMGINEMTKQAGGQNPTQEYNEAILFSGAKLSSIKAILIHSGITGRPPKEEKLISKQIVHKENKVSKLDQQYIFHIDHVEEEIKQINFEIRRLRGKSQTGRIIDLEKRKSELLAEKKELRFRQERNLKEVQHKKFVPHRQVTTSGTLRNRSAWGTRQLPDELKSWEKEKGYRGVPISYLFTHVNPKKISRDQLPNIASTIWAKGNAKWQEDLIIEREKMELEKQGPLILTGSKPKVPHHLSKLPTVPTTPIVVQALLHVNNCLINAISMATRGRNPSDAEIIQIRTKLKPSGFGYGEMLFASLRVINIIREALDIEHIGIRVKYNVLDSEVFQGSSTQFVNIYHKGEHFSHNQM